MYEKSYGKKYDDNLDIKDIAKKIRADIKAEIASGGLPKGKYSVTIKRYSGGQSMSITMSDLANGSELLNAKFFDNSIPGGYNHDESRYTEVGEALLKKVKRMVGAYNYDGSEPMVDYFNVNFYSHVNIDYDYENELSYNEEEEE